MKHITLVKVKTLYALVYESLRYKHALACIVNKVKLFEKEKKFDIYLAWVLVYDLLLGLKKLPGNSEPVNIILKYESRLKEALEKHLKEKSAASAEELVKDIFKPSMLPRYVRVNTILTTVADVLQKLENDGYQQVKYQKKCITLNKYYDMIRSLERKQFIQDIHFGDLLVFAYSENLAVNSLYKDSHIILQDKTSYLAAKMLSPPPNSIVLDGCAAPGIKTIHLATYMKNTGKLYACDINSERLTVLKKLVSSSGVKNCKPYLQNFTEIDPENSKFSDAEYILLDPSCSGSGMVNRMDYITDDELSKSKSRIQKLSRFQANLLRCALSFPKVKRIVYSTCSINHIENEEVIKECLSKCNKNFRVVKAFPIWPIRGNKNYEFGRFCLRAYPEKSLTNGFFIAVLERVENTEDTFDNTVSDSEEKDELQSIEQNPNKNRKLETEDTFSSNNDDQTSIKEFKEIKRNNLIQSIDDKDDSDSEDEEKKCEKVTKVESFQEVNSDENEDVDEVDDDEETKEEEDEEKDYDDEIYSDIKKMPNSLKRKTNIAEKKTTVPKKKAKITFHKVSKINDKANNVDEESDYSGDEKEVIRLPKRKTITSKKKVPVISYKDSNSDDKGNSVNEESEYYSEDEKVSSRKRKIITPRGNAATPKKRIPITSYENSKIDDEINSDEEENEIYCSNKKKMPSSFKEKGITSKKKIPFIFYEEDKSDGEFSSFDDENKVSLDSKEKATSLKKKKVTFINKEPVIFETPKKKTSKNKKRKNRIQITKKKKCLRRIKN
ncbi:probable 28S rRNA (cytosine-C(5))-methyltransferase isoform X2 [Centruroides sculpturatus]|uniref:probable 28S rRNA (cytosine-C(5))-methyltransferase isoform X2 n=1 Tax=Centruroides sculpturatus TaxID=218467 RepID=UPI000C6CE2C9|nr:probable 28S rRNA (cytosine-C(5))-methyltransferase isoform X2 [Centruroides sculpturatus]